MRLFVALPVPDAVRDALDAALRTPREATEEHLRWQQPDTWHLTLAFLGEVVDDDVEAVGESLESGLAERSAFDIVLGRPGRFGRAVLFLGVDDPTYASVVDLGGTVRTSLGDVGLAFDDKPLHPHLTLARQRDRRGRGVSRSQLELVGSALGTAFEAPVRWRADEVIVFASHLDEGPYRHEPLRPIRLR